MSQRCCAGQPYSRSQRQTSSDDFPAGIAELKVFGSRARGQAAPDSDIDILYALRQRRDALLWNFTVPGEAAGQVSEEVKERFPDIAWQQPRAHCTRCRRAFSPSGPEPRT